MGRNIVSITGLLVAAVLFVAVNVLSGILFHQARLDLTEDRLFTLSEGSKKILESIPEPITLRFFFSERLAGEVPAFRVYGARVRDLLQEYVTRSGGRLKLEVVDPEPYSDAEDRAVQGGLKGVPLDQQSGEQVYFGLVGTNTTDEHEVIPFFQQSRENFLEYDLTKLVYNLSSPKKPVVGLIGDVPLEYGPGGIMAAMQGRGEPYLLLEQLKSSFQVKTLENDLKQVPTEVSILVVARPLTLGKATQYAIDQYVMGGGKAVFFVDPWAESHAGAPGPGGMPNPTESKTALLPDLFHAWGIEIAADKFVADPKLALRVAFGQGGRQRAIPYVAWLAVPEQALASDDVVTAELSNLNLASVGAIRKVDGATVTLTPLVTSSEQSQLVAVSELQGSPDPERLLGQIGTSGGQAQVLAARVTGAVKSAFPDGPPAPEPKADDPAKPAEPAAPVPPASHRKQSEGPVNLIVVADSDLLEDRFWVQTQDFFGQRFGVPISSNADLVVNAIDNLAGSSDLIALRGRAAATRPFLVFDDLRRDAARQFLAREKELQEQLRQTERRLGEMQTRTAEGSGSGAALLSAQEQAEIGRFRSEMVRIRKQLRDVQHSLNQDIERLSAQIKIANIGLMPVAVAVLALALAGFRQRRRRTLRTRD